MMWNMSSLKTNDFLVVFCRQGDYTPKPADIRNVTLTRGMLEMAEKMAENAHDIWAKKKKMELESIGSWHFQSHYTIFC